MPKPSGVLTGAWATQILTANCGRTGNNAAVAANISWNLDVTNYGTENVRPQSQ